MTKSRFNSADKSRRARKIKELMTTLITPLAIIVLIISLLIKNDNKTEESIIVDSESVSSIFKNNSNISTKIRYKYILSHEVSDVDILKEVDLSKPLFSIRNNGMIISENYASSDSFGRSLPVVSEVIDVKPKEVVDKEFVIKYSEEIENEVKYNIRFEAKIITEELIKGKWTPVYQAIFMERGPYWSLDKGPIERLIKNEEEVDYEDWWINNR